MKSPYTTRPYRLRPKTGADRRRTVILYTAATAGPLAFMATIMAAALMSH